MKQTAQGRIVSGQDLDESAEWTLAMIKNPLIAFIRFICWMDQESMSVQRICCGCNHQADRAAAHSQQTLTVCQSDCLQTSRVDFHFNWIMSVDSRL